MLAAVLLAAGGSRRFGRPNKLLADVRGRRLVDLALDRLVALPAWRLLVVTGCDRAQVERLVRRRRDARLHLVHNPAWRLGLSASIGCGLRALRPIDRTLLVLLGDMPLGDRQDTRAVLRALARRADAARPWSGGAPGHPTGFRTHALRGLPLSGDRGLWAALESRPGARMVEVPGRGSSLVDVDTRAALLRLRRSEPRLRSRV